MAKLPPEKQSLPWSFGNTKTPQQTHEVVLPRAEYLHDTHFAATNTLLGAYLCTDIGGSLCVGKITELEIYLGDVDRASHAWQNKETPRNRVMFGPGGFVYMYLIYGIYPMFNIVTGAEGVPHAVLVRSLEPVLGIDAMKVRRGINNPRNLANGPGKLCIAMGLTLEQYGLDLTAGKTVWLSPKTEPIEPLAGKRIGIDYAGADRDLPWRFVIKGNPFISKPV
ncbi:MAG: DNA-3-methyladenine glycosylase [Treponema sp.]|nr:DNA-3-methyladenine glycosylase [Treponema sp.]